MDLLKLTTLEPNVIDESMINEAIISQGPKGEEGKIFKQQGIAYDKIEYLRLEFKNILVINHLWIFQNLKKIQLNNNIIQKIENLHHLKNLKELDLSFNNISKIENLNDFVNLEVLALFENKISRLSNLEELKKLTTLNVGNNLLQDKADIFYLRQMKNLKVLNLEGNPLCAEGNYKDFIFAYIPQLIYYAYRMIPSTEKKNARLCFKEKLASLEAEEANERAAELTFQEKNKYEMEFYEAFVEGLNESKFFDVMFEGDAEGKVLTEMGDDIQEAYREFQKNTCEVTGELHAFGLEQQKIRLAELLDYKKNVSTAKQTIIDSSREIVNEFLKYKKKVFEKVELIVIAFSESLSRKERENLSQEIADIRADFEDKTVTLWHDLMKKELYLLESMEKVNSTLERSLSVQITTLIEQAQAHFTQLRNLESTYHEVVAEVADRFFTYVSMMQADEEAKEELDIPPLLLSIMSDKEVMMNAVATSHEYHLLVIDKREDQLISRAKSWVADLTKSKNTSETNRSRNAIIEINHFLDHQRKELEILIYSTPHKKLHSALLQNQNEQN